MNLEKNKIILLIPHFNNVEGLKCSIESVNNESDFVDIVVIDDGSTVQLEESKLKALYKGQLFVINNKENRGIEHVLNDGLDFACKHNYDYIGRLDCGDLCLNNRFRKQYDFLENNTKVAIVGSQVTCVDESGDFLYTLTMPVYNDEIKKKMYLNAMLIHPSIFFRSSVIAEVGGYPIDYKSAEDYAFFFKLMSKYDFANIDECLVQIEINSKGISALNRERQIKNRIRLIKENFYWGYYPIYGLVRSYLVLCLPQKVANKIKKVLFK